MQARVAISNKLDFKSKLVSLPTDEGSNPLERCNNCKHINTKHRHTQFQKAHTTEPKNTDSNTKIVGDFNTPLSLKDRSSTPKNQQRNFRMK
jgi:hypothetical protein